MSDRRCVSPQIYKLVPRLAYVKFGHDPNQVSYDVIVLRHLIKHEIDALAGLDLPLEHDTIAIQTGENHDFIFAKIFLNSC